jgi:hypothetical protein
MAEKEENLANFLHTTKTKINHASERKIKIHKINFNLRQSN